jgi:hypothetical protein
MDILGVIFFADGAWFDLSGYVNSQNSLVWSATILHEIKDTPIHDQVFVWCAISRNRIIDPIFFNFNDIVDSERYCEMILQPFTGHLNEDEIAHSYFQHDSATAHTHTHTHSSCFRDDTARCVRGWNNLKGDLATKAAPSYTPLLLSVGSKVWRNLQRQSSPILTLFLK